jgi:hypothetical protein
MSESATQFEWKTHADAARLVIDRVESVVERNQWVAEFQQRLLNETGTRLIDWADRIGVSDAADFKLHGYLAVGESGESIWRHREAMLPDIFGTTHDLLAIHVDSVVDFLHANGFDDRIKIVGGPGSDIRRACVTNDGDTEFHIVERHGSMRWDPAMETPLQQLAMHQEAFRLRQRNFETDSEGFDHAMSLVNRAINDIGVNRACDLFFAAERDYWQNRNDAARIQKARQDRLGLGWGNHDHHTYRSGRLVFAQLMAVFEMLGFECRERFYAGPDAGWGAQVLEQPDCRIVIFADVDLSNQELAGDFAHEPLPPQQEPGTVGLWCALHGEAFLQAGLHHLECQFDFDASRDQLAQLGVETMAPFTDFEHLRQAFTVGQRWAVSNDRLNAAIDVGYVTTDEADRFRRNRVIGSHLEILERNHGYKGFNKTGISEIILETNPKAN